MTKRSYRSRRTRGRVRLTRRGRLVLLATAVAVLGAAVLVPVLLLTGGGGRTAPSASLVVPEGWRAAQVYASVDHALDMPAGTTRKAAASAHLDLAQAAKGNPEGYLYPATYPIGRHTTPATLLSFMVNTANEKYASDRLAQGAARDGISAYQAVVVASIVQAEAAPQDMGKVARVVLNRLALGMPLQMDSTLNYALNRSTLNTTDADTRTKSPYNTYRHKGLPPTPIGNPGDKAIEAVVDPPKGDWLYFVTVADGDTRFATSYAQQEKNVQKFNDNRRKDGGG